MLVFRNNLVLNILYGTIYRRFYFDGVKSAVARSELKNKLNLL